MNIHQIWTAFLIIVLTVISGWGDSRGFLYAANVWNEGKVVWIEVLKSGLGFTVGIISYWIVIKYLQEFSIISPEIQTIGWFAVTIIGVAISSGKFMQWNRVDQIVAILIVTGVGWLLFRTGG